MAPPKRPAPKLFALLAREALVGVVFRRGPTNQVLLIKWDLAHDTFEYGQWFKGRIYERRCDLSPSGQKLIYFAGNQKPPYKTWTAVSTPPYLTALALWPLGSTWGGGGAFETEHKMYLHHGCISDLAKGFRLSKTIHISTQKGSRDPDPLARDGWRWIEGDMSHMYYAERAKQVEVAGRQLELQFREEVFFEQGADRTQEYRLKTLATAETASLGFLDWADWDHNGDLLFAKNGKLFRATPQEKSSAVYDMNNARELADFSELTFENKKAPPEALKW